MIKRMNSNYEVLRLLTSRSEGDKEDREEREKEKDKEKISFLNKCFWRCYFLFVQADQTEKNVESEMEVNK